MKEAPRSDSNARQNPPATVDGLVALVARVLPGARLVATRPLGADAETARGTQKGAGYGQPMLIHVERDGRKSRFVLHAASANPFGHNRRADRAADTLLAYDSFARIPNHVPPLEVGAWTRDGNLVSLADATEFYLLTPFAEGEPYAHDLREVARRGALLARDLSRARELARYLAALHGRTREDPIAWQRAVRDLFGSGEGIFGIVDSFPENTPAAPTERIIRLERAALEYRPRLRRNSARLTTTHGDFHPFNILFTADGSLSLLDASRGCLGDAADDAICLSINYLFFGLLAEPEAKKSFRELWTEFFAAYFEARSDSELLSQAPPYVAWRALVLTNPVWYPDFPEIARDALLGFAERTLALGRLSIEDACELLS